MSRPGWSTLRAAALAAAAAACAAQDPWGAFLRDWRSRDRSAVQLRPGYAQARRNPLCLLVREEDAPEGFWTADEVLVGMVAEEELTPERVRAVDFARLRGGPAGPRWLLLDREGAVLQEGEGRPEGARILEGLRAAGMVPARDRREAFLREHPHCGEALEAELGACIAAVEARSDPAVLSPEAADAELAPTAAVLERLAELPDWWRLRRWRRLEGILWRPAAGASPRMRRVLERLRDSALAELRRNPQGGHPELERFWAFSQWALAGRRLPLVPDAAPAPGRAWPSRAYLEALGQPLLDAADWEGLLAFTLLLPPDPPAAPVSAALWQDYVDWRTLVLFGRLMALTGLQRWDEGAAALDELTRWMGPKADAREMASLLREVGRDPKAGDEVLPAAYRDVLAREPGPGMPPPASPFPLRLVLWGDPPWRAAWEALRGAPPLAPWGPGELRWENPTPTDRALLKEQGWREPRWAAFQGASTLLASGDRPPEPGLLALELAARGPTALQSLDAFILRHPGQLDARRDRYALLRPRMPHPVLEPQLAEDAARAWIPLDFGPGAPWISAPGLWTRQAEALLPQVAAALNRWPGSAQLWAVWTSWAPFGRVSTYALAMGLAHPEPMSEWIARLPESVRAAVVEELLRSRRFERVDAWSGAPSR